MSTSGKNGNCHPVPLACRARFTFRQNRQLPRTRFAIPAESATAISGSTDNCSRRIVTGLQAAFLRVPAIYGRDRIPAMCGKNGNHLCRKTRFPAKTATAPCASPPSSGRPADVRACLHRRIQISGRIGNSTPHSPRTERATRRSVACSHAEAGRGRE